MIRPITVICWLLALGSGLYLYRAKHEVEKIDKRIVQIGRETDGLRADSRRLLDEWIRLGEPEQLHRYSDRYLGLKTVAPTQFARTSELSSRLPPPRALPEGQLETMAPRSESVPGQTAAVETGTAETAELDELPVPPVPPGLLAGSGPAGPAAASAPAVPVASPRETSVPRPRVAEETNAPAPRPLATRVTEPRPPVPAQTAAVPPSRPLPISPPSQTSPQSGARTVANTPAANATATNATGNNTPLANAPLDPRSARGPDGQPRAGQPPAPYAVSSPQPPVSRPPSVQVATHPPAEPSGPRGAGAPPAPSGSLLGMSRGPVPLPLPAPTPVSANWNGSNGPGR